MDGDNGVEGMKPALANSARPTLKDVAREARVSQKTASRVLNERGTFARRSGPRQGGHPPAWLPQQ